MSGHSPWDELAVGLALGALEPEDEQTFLAHLATCPECAKTVADVEETAAEMAYAAPAEEPPPALLESIMAEVAASDRAVTPLSRAMPKLSRLKVASRTSAPARLGAGSAPTRPGQDVGRPAPAWLTRAAVILALLGLAGWNYQLRLDRGVKERSLANAAAAAELVADPDATSVTLESEGDERAKVFVKGDKAYLVVDDFERNDDENTIYVLWRQNHGDEKMYGVDSFKVVHDGPTYIPVRKELADSGDIAAFAISEETGSRIPEIPSEPIAAGTTTTAA